MASGVGSWSATASSNATADSTINWAEGQAPSTVNNSARAMMARIKDLELAGGWISHTDYTLTYVSSNSGTIASDVTGNNDFPTDRRVMITGATTGTVYGAVASASYSAPNTTLVFTLDSSSIRNETLTLYYSRLSPKALPARENDPTLTVYTSGSGTHAVTSGARWLLLRMAGGGAGGRGGGSGSPGNGGAGGNSTFGGFQASGGSAAADSVTGGAGGTANGDVSLTGGNGAAGAASVSGTIHGAGGAGGNSALGGAGGGTYGSGGGDGGAAKANTGSGGAGGAATASGTAASGPGGGAGGYLEELIGSPSATYAYAVGAGGAGGTAGTNGGAGGAGAAGIIIVEEYF